MIGNNALSASGIVEQFWKVARDNVEKNIFRLTSVEAVKEAIAECDKLGRDNFLAKYGYKPARKYPLEYNGREYDSKAIAGVAFGKQHGDPLKWNEFSGGLERAVPALRKLGFTIRGVESVAGGTLYSDARSTATEISKKNPKWSRDELMLALHLYLHNRQSPPGKSSKAVLQLSKLLGQMASRTAVTKTYRNTAGVYMKLMNFRSLDPLFTGAGKRGLTQGNKDDQVVWDLYAHRLEYLDSLVAKIEAAVSIDVSETGINEDDEPDIEDCEEGRVFTRMHRFRERNRKLAADFKNRYRKLHGRLDCAGCDRDFADRYRDMADRLIDVHHTKPVHTLKPGDKTSPKDLVLLCVSCHRAVHSEKKWLDIAELRRRIGKGPATKTV